MLIYVVGSYTWTKKVTIFDFSFELRFLANSSPSPEKLSKPPSCILIHDASLCIIMMILIHDSWSWNTVNNESFCITMHHGHEPWCIVMYHDDQSPSTSTCSTFPDWGGYRTQKQTRNPHFKVTTTHPSLKADRTKQRIIGSPPSTKVIPRTKDGSPEIRVRSWKEKCHEINKWVQKCDFST